MRDEIRVGDTLYISDYWAQPASTPERERARYESHTITGETHGKWLLGADDGGWYEVNKRTLKLCGRDETRIAYTAQQLEVRMWERIHRPALARLVLEADVATLQKVAEVVGYHPNE